MEILGILAGWLFLLYVIRIHKEIAFYRRIYNQHKDIYVPSYTEVINGSIWTVQLKRYLVEILKIIFSKFSMKNISIDRKDSSLAILTLSGGTEEKI